MLPFTRKSQKTEVIYTGFLIKGSKCDLFVHNIVLALVFNIYSITFSRSIDRESSDWAKLDFECLVEYTFWSPLSPQNWCLQNFYLSRCMSVCRAGDNATWSMLTKFTHKWQLGQNRCLRRGFGNFWKQLLFWQNK